MAFVYPSPLAICPSSLSSLSSPFLPPPSTPFFCLPLLTIRTTFPPGSFAALGKTIVASLETAYVFASLQDAARWVKRRRREGFGEE